MLKIKIKKKKGFTLIELIAVVAIMSILIGISIPIFNSQIEKSKAAVDMSNVKTAKTIATAEYITYGNSKKIEYYYDKNDGIVKTKSDGIEPYGKSEYDLEEDNAKNIPKDKIIKIEFNTKSDMSLYWVSAGSNDGLDSSISEFLDNVEKKEWKDASKNSSYGKNIAPGTVLLEDETVVITYGNNDYFKGNLSKMSLDEFANKYNNRVRKIDSSVEILSEEYCENEFSAKKYTKGTIANYDGKYYILKQDMSYNKWEHAKKAFSDGNWVIIK